MGKTFYKSKMSKNGRWGVAFERFHQGCKNLKLPAYRSGIRFWKDSFNTGTIAVVVKYYRFMIYFPIGKTKQINK